MHQGARSPPHVQIKKQTACPTRSIGRGGGSGLFAEEGVAGLKPNGEHAIHATASAQQAFDLNLDEVYSVAVMPRR